jgi:hypothetical protein
MSGPGMPPEARSEAKSALIADGPHDERERAWDWLPYVQKLRRHQPRVFGSAVVLAHVQRLIESGEPLDPDKCARCAQLVVSLREADGG